jgi:flavin reductase (DIM6/NTAB) family NADH-FMN oxidoreductase RutF
MSDSVPVPAFREALARFASGVTIVAAREGDRLSGFTATAFSSVSLEPPLVLICIAHTASAYDAVLAADKLGISVLSEEQGWAAKQFATHGIDRFEGVSLAPGRTVPLLEGALAHLECRRHAAHEAGDHTILVLEVLAAGVTAGAPLLHFERKLGGFDAEPATRAAAAATNGASRSS